jgi:hypothetical protein
VTLLALLVAVPAIVAATVDLAFVVVSAARGRLCLRALYGWLAVAQALAVVALVAEGNRAVASGAAGLLVVACWLWWTHGGGDGPKRRLRRLRARFAGVRRTAPATAMAVAR